MLSRSVPCFSGPYFLEPRSWEKLTYFPALDFSFNVDYFKDHKLIFDDLIKYWGGILNLWDIDLQGNELTPENWGKGFTFINQPNNVPIFMCLTCIRYLVEGQYVLFQMIELGEKYPELFTGTRENTWNAFCLAHCSLIISTKDHPVNYPHCLIPQARLKESSKNIIVNKNSRSIYGMFPGLDPNSPMPQYYSSSRSEFLQQNIEYLKARNAKNNQQTLIT